MLLVLLVPVNGFFAFFLFFGDPSSMASKLKSVNVGGACFLDTLSRALRRSNAEEEEDIIVEVAVLYDDLFKAAPDLL